MATKRMETMRWEADRLRIGAWRGDQSIAYVAPLPDGRPPTATGVRQCLAALARRGYRGAVTSALTSIEERPFLDAGFAHHESLHLLAHDLLHLDPTPRGVPLRRARRLDHPDVLAVDGRAFSPFWRLDRSGLREALTATPTARFRVSTGLNGVAGYAVNGRAGQRGYLQRLAVDPDAQGRGVGRALVLDGLHWLRRRGVRQVVVNTQEGNDRAVGLYQRLGFRMQPHGLTVLRCEFPGEAEPWS